MEKLHERLTLALSIIAILLFAYFITNPPQPTPISQPTPSLTPTPCREAQYSTNRSVAEVRDYVARVMASYSDLIYAEVPTPVFNGCDGSWYATVTMSRQGIIQRALLRINDSGALFLDKAYLEGPIPPIISQNKVVTNGTVQLYGKLNCSTDKVRVWEFSDPYCPTCIAPEQKIDEFRERYGEDIDFEYHVLLSRSILMENSYGKDDVERISRYFVCAQKQGLLMPLKECALAKYTAKGVEAPLSKEELDACVPNQINRTAFDSCVAREAPADIAFDSKVAETYQITETPMMLVDCMYRMHPTYLEHGFCFIHPEICANSTA